MAPNSDREPHTDIAHVTPKEEGIEATASMHRRIEELAAQDSSVLLLGGAGIGEQHWALTIHSLSARAPRAFVIVNCAASETVLESELFGYENADSAKPGLLETAEGGTLFLDEIDRMPLSVQAKLLRAIETRQTLRAGATQARAFDVRILAATRRELEAEISAGRFRQDLHDRLASSRFVPPTLRERGGEVAGFARFFANPAEHERRTRAPELPPEAHAPLEKRRPGTPTAASSKAELERLVAEARVKEIVDALASCGGNQTRAARLLGISRRTLVNRMAQHGLPRPRGSRR